MSNSVLVLMMLPTALLYGQVAVECETVRVLDNRLSGYRQGELHWFPDGSRVVAHNPFSLYLYEYPAVCHEGVIPVRSLVCQSAAEGVVSGFVAVQSSSDGATLGIGIAGFIRRTEDQSRWELWDVDNWQRTEVVAPDEPVTRLTFTPDGEFICRLRNDPWRISLVSMKSKSEVASIPLGYDPVQMAALETEGNAVRSAFGVAVDHSVINWHLVEYETITQSRQVDLPILVTKALFVGDGETVVVLQSADWPDTSPPNDFLDVACWQLGEPSQQAWSWQASDESTIVDFAIYDDRIVVVATRDSSNSSHLEFLDIATGAPVGRHEIEGAVFALAVHPTDPILAIITSETIEFLEIRSADPQPE